MRPASMLLSAIILLSCLSIHAYAIEPGDIAAPSIDAPNMDMPNPIVSSPNMGMPDTKSAPSVKPNNDLSSVPNQTGNISSNQTQATQTQQKVKPIDVSGKWSVRFDDGTDRSLDLTLWSSAGAAGIMGFGTLAEEGKRNSVTASGSVTEQELQLIAKLAAPEYSNLKYDELDLDLFMANNALSGTYFLKSNGQFLGMGNATAMTSVTT